MREGIKRFGDMRLGIEGRINGLLDDPIRIYYERHPPRNDAERRGNPIKFANSAILIA